MKRLLGVFFAVLACAASAQDRQLVRGPYLIPQIVYVGDRAALVVPLSAAPAQKDAIISLDPDKFPVSPEIELHRVVLERRGGGSRLLVEFSAFVPGVLELPPIEIGGERFSGLRLEISSIIGAGESGAVLSGPALPLAIPGTSLLVYGTMAVLVLFLLLALWLGFWGRRHLGGWILKWKRRRLIVFMSGIERRLRKSLLKGGNCREILNTLSAEFRSFLSFFTGKNCRAMTACELTALPPLTENGVTPYTDASGPVYPELRGSFLGAFFRRCDALRFSGAEIISGDVLAMLGDLRRFLESLDRAGRGKFMMPEGKA